MVIEPHVVLTGLGPDGQVQPSLGRRATVAGMEGLAQSAGIARHHSDAWPSLHAAQATSQGSDCPCVRAYACLQIHRPH